MSTDDKFNNATYYSCSEDCESLTHATPEDAIAEYLDACAEVGESLRSVIERNCPVSVDAYERDEVDDGFAKLESLDLAERFAESWGESYGNVFEGDDQIDQDELAKELQPILERYAKSAVPWQCSKGMTKIYSVEDVLAIHRIEIHDEEHGICIICHGTGKIADVDACAFCDGEGVTK